MTTDFYKSDEDQLSRGAVVSKQLMTKLLNPRTDEFEMHGTPSEFVLDSSFLKELFVLPHGPLSGETRDTTNDMQGYTIAPVNPATPAEPKIYNDDHDNPTIEGFKLYEQAEKTRDGYEIDDLEQYSYDDPSKKDYNLNTELTKENVFTQLQAGYRPYIRKSIIGRFPVPLTNEVQTLINQDPQDYDFDQAKSVIEPYIDYFDTRFNPQLRLVLFKKENDNPFGHNIVLRQKPLRYNSEQGRLTVTSSNALFPSINGGGTAATLYEELRFPAGHPHQRKSVTVMLDFANQLLVRFRGYDVSTDPLNDVYQLWLYKITKVKLMTDGNIGTQPWNNGYKVTPDDTTGASENDLPFYFPDGSDDDDAYVTLWIYASKIWDQAHGIVPPDPVVGHDEHFTGPFSRIGAIKDSVIRVHGKGHVENDNPLPHSYFTLKKGDVLKGFFPKVRLHPSDPAGHIFLKTE